jgi:putative membrane-bound dehydrogenase-like protein
LRPGAPALAVVALALAGALVLAPARPACADEPLDGPLPAENAPASFRLEPGLRIELVAAEPLVISPVALAFDERGRLFVAENRGYPTGPAPGEPPAGRIAMLEDTDDDGRMDRRTEFAEGLTYPNGLMPWGDGLIVTCAPDVFFLRDTDGDGKADERKVLFTGFATTGSTQLRVSHPTLSPDNWVYLTSGLTGGSVTAPAAPERPPVGLKRVDFRFRPDGDAWEAADGGAQFGLTFDDFGRRFICYNRVQVQHVVIASKTLRRNTHLAFSDTIQNCPIEPVPEPLPGHGAGARLFPLSRNVTTADSHAGTFTAACAVTVFRGSNLPERYRGCVFSCDPTGNLIHVDKLEPQGATFGARPVRERAEFLASTDNWFRPVFLAHGPDGALYFCDMYRKTIEHPDYLPVEIRKRTDFDSGKTMGRLWRVVRDHVSADELRRLRNVNLGAESTAQVCDRLRDRNGWRQDTAQRILLKRRDHAAVEPLRKIAADPSADPSAVVRALHLLDAFGGLSDDLLRAVLKHSIAPVRENALALVETRLAHDRGWLSYVIPLADDEDARVRFQAAIALGALPASSFAQAENQTAHDSIASALARIAARDGGDRWTRAAVFSSLAGRDVAFLTALRDLPKQRGGPPSDLLTELGRLLGASQPQKAWPGLVRIIAASPRGFPPEERAALVTGLAEAARSRVASRDSNEVLMALTGSEADLAGALRDLVAAMQAIARDPAQPLARRIEAAGLLAFADFEQTGATLLQLVDPQQSGALQSAAVRALGAQRDARVVQALLAPERFLMYPPALREEVLSTLTSQAYHLPSLLTALEDGRVPRSAIDALRRRQLTQSRDAEIRRRAEKLFGTVQGDRAKVYEEYQDVINLKPDPAAGRAVFRRECSSCHRLDQEGFPLGPDLFGIRNQPKPTILLHVLIPDQEITQGFVAYTVATKDGRVRAGLVSSETPTSLTLRQPLGKEDTILRSEIDELSASQQSLMPQGLEKNITRQEFADLLAYLKGEGNSPGENAP